MTQTVKIANRGVNANDTVINASNIAASCTYTGASIYSNTLTIGSNWSDAVSIKMEDLAEAVDKLTKTPEVPTETATKLDFGGGKIFVKQYKDGFYKSERLLMDDIKDVTVHNKTVIVTFTDNTKTVAVLDKEDTFSLEQGISICITKKLLGENGSSIYNKLIKRALKVKKQNEKAAEKAKKAKEEEKKRKELALARHKKKMAKKREEKIEIQKEAYIRAMKSLKN